MDDRLTGGLGGEVAPAGLRRARFSRREMLRGAGGLALGAALSHRRAPFGAVREAGAASADRFAAVQLPPDLGQTDLRVFVPDTGHTVRGSMLDYWRANGAAAVYGNPISEPFPAADGYYSQAFENAVFQYRPEYLDTEDPIVRLMPIGQVALTSRPDASWPAGRRGGGERTGAIWRSRAPDDDAVARIVAAGGLFVEATGHTLDGDFLTWYTAHEGPFYLGHPLSQPVAERGMTVQWFEGALLMQADDGSIYLAPLAAELAPLLGIDTTPVDQGDLPVYNESLFRTAEMPNPQGDPEAPGRHWIEVSLGKQQLWAYQGDTAVMTTLVSTGLPPNVTAPGTFHVRLKFPKQSMKGFTNESGEVVSFGETPTASGEVPYNVPDVPNVMYFSLSAEALHGTYWHNNFGNPMSHGCVNLPLDVAAWMYGWAPLGTEVVIHE